MKIQAKNSLLDIFIVLVLTNVLSYIILISSSGILENVISDQLTFWSVFIILTFFFSSFALLLKSYLKINADVKACINNPEHAKNLEGSIATAWKQYVLTFIRVPDDKGNEVLKSSASSKQYLNLVSLFGYESIRYWHTVPGIFVGLGVLGTFLGLTVGLSEISSEMFNNPDVLEQKLSVLIGGMKTAFVSSVFGMSTSVLFSLFQRFVFGSLENNIKILDQNLDQQYRFNRREDYQRLYTFKDQDRVLYPRDFMAKVIELLSDNYEVSSEHYKVSLLSRVENKALQEQQTRALEELKNNIGTTISTELSGIGEVISQSFSTHFAKLTETIERMTTSMEKMPDLLEDMHNKFQEEIEFQRANIHNTFQSIHENLTTEVSRVTEALRTQSEEIMQQLRDTSLQVGEQLSALTRESTERLQEVADTLIESMSRTVEHLRETLIAMESGAERMTVLLDDTREMLERQESAVEEITAAINEMDTSFATLSDLSSSMTAFSGHVTTGTEAIVSSSENLRQVVEQFSNEYHRMSAAESTFHNEIRTAIEETQTLVHDAAEQYNQVRTGLADIFGEVENGLSRYTALSREGLNEYLNLFASQFNEAANQLERNFNSLNILSERMQDAVGRIDGSWQQGLHDLEQVSARIARASEGLPASLNQFQQLVRDMPSSSSGVN